MTPAIMVFRFMRMPVCKTNSANLPHSVAEREKNLRASLLSH
jgi:hypothetical protein